MSALGFLHADAQDGAPPARSPMADDAEAAGARSETRDGWLVTLDYGEQKAEETAVRKTVAFVDLSHLGVLELQGDEPALDAIEPLPTAPRGGREDSPARRAQDAWWCRVAPERALVICDGPVTRALREQLDGRGSSSAGLGSDVHSQLVDMTSAYGKLVFAGPLAREAIARFCALDLRPRVTPVAAFRPGSVARAPGAVLCEAPDRYLVLFGAAYGSYVWTVAADAAANLGGRPAGVEALTAAAPITAPISQGEARTHA